MIEHNSNLVESGLADRVVNDTEFLLVGLQFPEH